MNTHRRSHLRTLDVHLMIEYDDPKLVERQLDTAMDALQSMPGIVNIYYTYDGITIP